MGEIPECSGRTEKPVPCSGDSGKRGPEVDADKARELIRKTDKQRKSYYNFFADGNWGVRSNYDLMLRTDDHTPEEIAEMIIAYAHPGK